MKKYFLFTALFIIQTGAIAQHGDSLSTSKVRHKNRPITLIVPASLIVLGVTTMLDKDADETFLSNFEVREKRNENFINFSNHLDDYLQHAPSATAFILSLSRVKGKHDLPNQLALYVKSEMLMLCIVYPLKYTVGEARPDTGAKNSFPSGHTAQAFAAATFFPRNRL